MEITLVEGDITTQRVDAIVNAANSSPLGRQDSSRRQDQLEPTGR
ncbi:hypothetical protein [Micromonospora sp. C31]|nr:hypothetical protein [Micromonospora sp. C31]